MIGEYTQIVRSNVNSGVWETLYEERLDAALTDPDATVGENLAALLDKKMFETPEALKDQPVTFRSEPEIYGNRGVITWHTGDHRYDAPRYTLIVELVER